MEGKEILDKDDQEGKNIVSDEGKKVLYIIILSILSNHRVNNRINTEKMLKKNDEGDN